MNPQVVIITCTDCKKQKPQYTKLFPNQCKWCFIRTWGGLQ